MNWLLRFAEDRLVLTLMTVALVLLDGGAAGSPYAVGALVGFQASAAGGLAQCFIAESGVLEGPQRHDARRAGDAGDDEAVQVVDHRAGDLLSQAAGVTPVGVVEGKQIFFAVALEDDGRRKSEADENQIQCEATGASVAVEKWVDPLEGVVRPGQLDRQVPRCQIARRNVTPEVGGVVPPRWSGLHRRPARVSAAFRR